jgi:hypothetical protein
MPSKNVAGTTAVVLRDRVAAAIAGRRPAKNTHPSPSFVPFSVTATENIGARSVTGSAVPSRLAALLRAVVVQVEIRSR